MSLRELSGNMQNLNLDMKLKMQEVLGPFLMDYVTQLGDDDLEGLAFSADIHPDQQEATFGVGDQDFLTMEFVALSPSNLQAQPIKLDDLLKHLHLHLEAHKLVKALLSHLDGLGRFSDGQLDGSIYTCLWAPPTDQTSVALFWETDVNVLAEDIVRKTVLF